VLVRLNGQHEGQGNHTVLFEVSLAGTGELDGDKLVADRISLVLVK
jgi:hypothetical protein